jgi:transposase
MFQVTPQMRILVGIEPVDGRKGIDSLAQLCRAQLGEDPFSGCVFLFRNKNATTLTMLAYDGQGFWLARKRLSKGRFRWWPDAAEPAAVLQAYQAQVLMAAGDPSTKAAPVWRAVRMPIAKAS